MIKYLADIARLVCAGLIIATYLIHMRKRTSTRATARRIGAAILVTVQALACCWRAIHLGSDIAYWSAFAWAGAAFIAIFTVLFW